MADKLDVDKALARLLEAHGRYEAARKDIDAIRSHPTETPQRKQQILTNIEPRRDEAADDIATCVLIYQEAARAHEAEGNAQLTATNLTISESMKRWTIVVGMAGAAQTIATIVQLWHGWGK